MKILSPLLFASALCLCTGAANAPANQQLEDGFRSIFDGKTLDGWDGAEGFWSVEDGAITGETTPENPTKRNTFLLWTGGETKDFELRLEYRILSDWANSGIQYRSEHLGNHVLKGYQADIESGKTYSGINYGEKTGRGILARRGKRVWHSDDKAKRKTEVIGDAKALQSEIHGKGEWNQYHISARGAHMIHQINGVVMSETIDNSAKKAQRSGVLGFQLHAGDPMKIQFRKIWWKPLTDQPAEKIVLTTPKKIILISGTRSHGYGAHEFNAGNLLMARMFEERFKGLETQVFLKGAWPKPEDFEDADSVVIFCNGGKGHIVNAHLDQFDALMKKGVGAVFLHYGVETADGRPGEMFKHWIGGHFERHWSVNPHWTAQFKQLPEHPITRGVKPFAANDEWYFHMRFRPNMEGVTPILSAVPPLSTIKRKDGPHSGNPAVRKEVKARHVQHTAWAFERPDGGRGFGFTGLHWHRNYANDDFRKLVLNAIAWTAKIEIPKQGILTATPTEAELEAHQDYPKKR